MVKEIPLQNGMVALVDDEDFERVNQYAWYANNQNDKRLVVKNSTVGPLCRFVLGVEDENAQVTHKNKNPLDCRKENLLSVERKKTPQTRMGCRNTTSKYKGVCWNKRRNKWTAQIGFEGKMRYLGAYTSEDEAAKAYNSAALEFFGEHAYQNIIGTNNNSISTTFESINQSRRNNKTGYRGVRINGKKFCSLVYFKGEDLYVGNYDTPEEAAKAYDKKAIELYGDKAILNFPNDR